MNESIKMTTGEKVFAFFNVLILTGLSICCLYPFLYVVFASLSNSNELVKHSGILLKPLGFSIAAYKVVLTDKFIASGYRNTLFILVVGVTINLVLTSLGAYFFSRKNVLFRNALMFLVIVTMFFSGGLIPTYIVIRTYHLYNSLWALILPSAVSAFNMIIMRTFMAAIPPSLEESASIDGANHFQILYKIYLPLCKPVIAVMILYYGVAHWNSWFSAMIYLTKKEQYPLQLILRDILILGTSLDKTTEGTSQYQEVQESIKYTTIVVSTLPVLIIYPLMQKYFVQGMMLGSVKE